MADESQPPVSGQPKETAEQPVPPAGAAPADAPAPADAAAPAPLEAAASDGDQIDFEALLKQASFDDPSVTPPPESHAAAAEAAAANPSAGDSTPFDLPSFQQVMRDAQVSSIDLLRDVELNVKIELGRSRMFVEDVLKLGEGSVVELDKLAGDPVDVFVNDRLVARGEVLVLNDNFCVRVNEIVAGAKDEVV
jgi:flagellar motor switch protein FliN/FliY